MQRLKEGGVYDIQWEYHPTNNNYMYSTNLEIGGWCLVKKSNSSVVVGVISDLCSRLIDAEEAKAIKGLLKLEVTDTVYTQQYGLFYEPCKINFTVVGMRYHGGHMFKKSDKVYLKREPYNLADKNAIAVIVNNIHVAYVCREDAVKLVELPNIEQLPIEVVHVYDNRVLMRLTVPNKGEYKINLFNDYPPIH